jgi:hypothetical protein
LIDKEGSLLSFENYVGHGLKLKKFLHLNWKIQLPDTPFNGVGISLVDADPNIKGD